MARIYLASSWRNAQQPAMVDLLRRNGHQVYDFRNPPHSTGFGWKDVALVAPFTAAEYRNALLPHPRAAQGLELGWMAGAGKRTIIVTQDGEEPELMALLADQICISADELVEALR